jgi:D-beta-D-heptose 7-phosphate kinase/D-beta-D-heptose 1-phosphate adenosyltransferase
VSAAVPDRVALVRHLERFAARRLAVVGDVILDHFVYGRVNRISPEAPVPVIEFDHEQFRLGGAANVAHNLVALGARPTLVGIVGDDDGGQQVRASMTTLGLSLDGIIPATDRPTTRKMRVVTTRNQQVARIDFEREADVAGAIEAEIIRLAIDACADADAILVSDYLKGVVTANVMRALVRAAGERHVPLLVDPKIPHLPSYQGATLVTPNHHEAEIATAMRIRSDEDARAAARVFRGRAKCTSVLITRGEHGMWLLEGEEGQPLDRVRAELPLAAVAREVADVTGAGDTVLATLGVALAAQIPLAAAAMLANYAAGISVSKFGPANVSREELHAALEAGETVRPH